MPAETLAAARYYVTPARQRVSCGGCRGRGGGAPPGGPARDAAAGLAEVMAMPAIWNESPRVLWRLPIHGRVGRWEQHGSIRTSCVTGRSGWCWTWSRTRTSVTAACRKVGGELGIKADTLRGWAKQAQVDRGLRPGSTLADAARMRALERENAELRRVDAICARRALFSRPSSATGNPGGGLHRGLPRGVRGRADLPGAAPGRGAHLAVGVLRGPGAAAAARAVRDAALEKQILRVWKDSGERYGAWKVWDQLNREGIAAARCTVERLMRKLGLRGVRRGGYKVRTTRSDPSQDRPEDLVNRDFAPDAPTSYGWSTSPSYPPGRAPRTPHRSSTRSPG